MTLSFEWDDEKAAANLIKHHVPFALDSRVYDPARIDRYDGREDYGEDRFLTIGLVGTVIVVVTYTMRGETVRLISARKAERHEQPDYWKNR
jgi:uncharacterized DUF497 family protein